MSHASAGMWCRCYNNVDSFIAVTWCKKEQIMSKKSEYYAELKPTTLMQELRSKLSVPPYSDVGLNQYIRLGCSEISTYYNLIQDIPQNYLEPVYNTTTVGLSGDVYYGKVQDNKNRTWDAFIISRPSDYRGTLHITQDTLALSSLNAGDMVFMYMHSNYKGRYMPPAEFDQFRNQISPGCVQPIPTISSELSAGGFVAKGFEHIRVNCSKR